MANLSKPFTNQLIFFALLVVTVVSCKKKDTEQQEQEKEKGFITVNGIKTDLDTAMIINWPFYYSMYTDSNGAPSHFLLQLRAIPEIGRQYELINYNDLLTQREMKNDQFHIRVSHNSRLYRYYGPSGIKITVTDSIMIPKIRLDNIVLRNSDDHNDTMLVSVNVVANISATWSLNNSILEKKAMWTNSHNTNYGWQFSGGIYRVTASLPGLPYKDEVYNLELTAPWNTSLNLYDTVENASYNSHSMVSAGTLRVTMLPKGFQLNFTDISLTKTWLGNDTVSISGKVDLPL